MSHSISINHEDDLHKNADSSKLISKFNATPTKLRWIISEVRRMTQVYKS